MLAASTEALEAFRPPPSSSSDPAGSHLNVLKRTIDPEGQNAPEGRLRLAFAIAMPSQREDIQEGSDKPDQGEALEYLIGLTDVPWDRQAFANPIQKVGDVPEVPD